MKKRLFKLFLILLIIGGSIFLYQITFAKYKKSVDQEIDISLARWNIKLNNESIAGKSSIVSDITPVFEDSEYVAADVLAPGITGYFDIEIDASEVDVSFSYSLTVNTNDSETYPDIVAYGYIVNPDDEENISDITDDIITGTIIHNTDMTKLRIFIKWDDSDTNAMDNAEDTALAINNSSITMHAIFTFTQINS